jgi:hypothetical protein
MTVYHASRAKRAADPVLAKVLKAEAAELQHDLDLAFVAANPQIGMLMRRGKTIYYVGLPVYRESRNPRDLVEA